MAGPTSAPPFRTRGSLTVDLEGPRHGRAEAVRRREEGQRSRVRQPEGPAPARVVPSIARRVREGGLRGSPAILEARTGVAGTGAPRESLANPATWSATGSGRRPAPDPLSAVGRRTSASRSRDAMLAPVSRDATAMGMPSADVPCETLPGDPVSSRAARRPLPPPRRPPRRPLPDAPLAARRPPHRPGSQSPRAAARPFRTGSSSGRLACTDAASASGRVVGLRMGGG